MADNGILGKILAAIDSKKRFAGRNINDLLSNPVDFLSRELDDTNAKLNARLDPNRSSEQKMQDALELVTNFGGVNSILSKGRLTSLMRETAYAHQPRTKTALTTMTPDQFLNLTVGKNPTKQQIMEEAGKFNPERFNQESQYPTLYMENNTVIGHEGRHRMAGLINSGSTTPVPIVLKNTYGAMEFDEMLKSIFKDGPDIRGQFFENVSVTPSTPTVALHPDNVKELLKFVNDSMLKDTIK